MQPRTSVPDIDEDAESAADALAMADIEAGRVVSGEAVKAWLRSWGRPDELPAPKIGD
jgi:predicted transcriptional regulator